MGNNSVPSTSSNYVVDDIYQAIGKLMFAYGDDVKPIETCQQLVMNILHEQILDTINRAKQYATQRRGCKRIECIDLLFLLRKYPFHLTRIYHLAKSVDLLRGIDENNDAECDNLTEFSEKSSDLFGKGAQTVYDAVGVFDVTGELQQHLKNGKKIDEEKRDRLKRFLERGSLMDEDEYREYTAARTYTFCAGHGIRKAKISRFLKWLGDPKIATNALIVLNYLVCEMICCLVEGALWSRKEEAKDRCVEDIYPFKALQPRHYEESLRKNKAYAIGGNLLLGVYYSCVAIWMKPAGRSLTDLLEKRRRSAYSIRSSRDSSYSSTAVHPKKAELGENEDWKSQSTPDGSVKYCYQQSKNDKKPLFEQLCFQLQCIYKKSRIHGAFPILILIAYSLLGGLIFYLIECPNEKLILEQKKAYFEREKRSMLRLVLSIEQVVRHIRSNYSSNRLVLSKSIRIYKKFALNRIDKAVYWYVLNMYHLLDQESYKANLLQPAYPEKRWLYYFATSFGQMYALKNYTEQLSLRYWEIALEQNDNAAMVRRKMDAALIRFSALTGLTHLFIPSWTFWNAMFLAGLVTTYTTIGYGNITPNSKLGKLVAMLYAAIGIPLVLMILHKLGRQSLRILELFWDQLLNLIEHVRCLRSGEPIKKHIREQLHDSNIPLILPVGIAVGWMFLCAAVFLKFETNWDYFKSFYFFFCSLTTIGYGDVTPTNSEDMFVIFGLIMVGLALVSMCINVVQLKLEQLFEELLVMVLEEYKQKGVPAEGMKVPSKVDLLAIWRMWQKRRRQRKIKRKDTTGSSTFLRIKRGRQAVFEQMRRALHMVNRGTQTDESIIGAYMAIGQECTDSVSWSEASVLPPILNPVLRLGVRNVENVESAPFTFTTSASGHDLTYEHCLHVARKPDLESSNLFYSHEVLIVSPAVYEQQELCKVAVVETPTANHNASKSYFAPSPEQASESGTSSVPETDCHALRSWTFVEAGKSVPGAQRGLIAPYMYTSPKSGQVHTTEMRRLLAELNARIDDCRAIASSSDSATTVSSSTAGSSL